MLGLPVWTPVENTDSPGENEFNVFFVVNLAEADWLKLIDLSEELGVEFGRYDFLLDN